MSAPATLHEMKQPISREASLPAVAPGFGSLQSFELMQRAAKLLSNSTLVPAAYRAFDDKKGENPNALANCVVALNMSQRMGADALMVMQNLYIVEGRPSWSSQWIIAAINGCGRFSPLRFELKDLGQKEVEYAVTEWVNRERQVRKMTAKVRNLECVAWAIEKETGERITSPAVNIEMAVKEGWYGKNGSKWQTMLEVMLRYRTASFFGKLYAPELLMGLQSVEEAHDMIDLHPDGSVASVTPAMLRARDIEQAKVVSSDPSVPAGVDPITGEVIDDSRVVTAATSEASAAPSLLQQSVPTVADAIAFVKQGDDDMARDIGRALGRRVA
ncbi:hypothetical protein [Dyella sp. M7H15-1]|uniref:hypothetical protein n=1 Tax=Dyella sp. M7H15-1 TaxID=2501295 RepID=UPI00197AB1C6|nr:hypothetical protein [Dyella sp. M7H15-1]